jgi:alkanesulfonate monooxygenase SsuD/methylene tetrahydromethanopterin reductase-like flavin-dependent oxidoreductase (luciferase family)
MAMNISRFNFVQPNVDPAELSKRYQAGLEMARYCDDNGFAMITLEEHHGADDGWSPTPLLNAGMILNSTKNVGVNISALLLPLHDPIRVAEDIAVMDLAHPGRLSVILGIGYRPSEYQMHGKDWSKRGALMDEAVDVLLKAWSGEPFEYRGGTVKVTPKPVTQPHPTILLGGTSKVAARRAARFGLPMFPAAHMPELEAYYYAQCEEFGTQGFLMMPGNDTVMLHVHDDPDKAWAELGEYFMYEAMTYKSWQTSDISSAVHSHATTAEELRKEGIYQVLTPEEIIAKAQAMGDAAAFNMHPLVGGMPIDEAWKSLHLFVEQVLPKI